MKKQVSQKQLSQIVNVTPQAIAGATARGLLFRDESGLYDLTNKENRAFLKERNIEIKNIQIPETTPAGRPVQNKPQGKIKSTHNSTDKTQSDLKKENIELKNEKLRLEIAKKNKELLPVTIIEDIYITYLERFNTTIERLAGTFIKDIGKDILDKGEVQPVHITRFINHVLEITHNNKLVVQKMFNAYTPE
jgi:hypothetical protein